MRQPTRKWQTPEPTGEQVYLFRHALVRDVVYHLQLPARRAALHALAAELIESVLAGAGQLALDAAAAEIAFHCRLAADHDDSPLLRRREREFTARAAAYARRINRNLEAAQLYERLAALSAGRDAVDALMLAGHAANDSGRYDSAEALFGRALGLAQGLGETHLVARAHLHLATAVHFLGRIQEEHEHLMKARAGLAPDRVFERISLDIALATYWYQCGEMDKAEQCYQEAAQAARAAGNKDQEARALGNLAAMFRQTDRIARAEELFARALELQRELGNRRAIAVILGNLATLHHAAGRLDQAERMAQDALAMHADVGNFRSVGVVWSNLASLYIELERLDDARAACERAQRIHLEIGNRRYEGVTLATLGDCEINAGRYELAKPLLSRALAIHREVRDRRSEGLTLSCLCVCALAQGEAPQAREFWQQGARLLRDVKDGEQLRRETARMREFCQRAGVPPFGP